MTAFLFPGQGAQYPGMGKDFAEAFPKARQTFEEANDLLNENISKIIFEGPADLLTETRNSQLAIFINSMAILNVIHEQLPDLKPSMAAGLSLGEYTAICATGRLSFNDTLFLVRERAIRMNDACEKRRGTMAAVLGLSAVDVEAAVHGLEDVWVANYNCPGQTVISGTEPGIAKAADALKARGAKRVIPLTVHGAFHSGLMQSAQDGLAPFIERAKFLESAVPLVMNVPGDFVQSESDLRRFLTSQVTQSVRWEQGIGAMEKRGVSLYLEIGCGKTLAGMNKKIGVAAPTHTIDKVADLDQLGGLCSC
jgi:[acyl-carrier-protein] S-malonyltransferase